MAKSVRSQAIEAAAEVLSNDGAWRNWGALTVARAVVKAMEAAGYVVIDGTLGIDEKIVKSSAQNDSLDDGEKIEP
jgi:hypothetical protein